MTDTPPSITYDPQRGAITPTPDTCPICAAVVRQCYDVHMVLAHPETRPQPARPLDDSKKKRKRR